MQAPLPVPLHIWQSPGAYDSKLWNRLCLNLCNDPHSSKAHIKPSHTAPFRCWTAPCSGSGFAMGGFHYMCAASGSLNAKQTGAIAALWGWRRPFLVSGVWFAACTIPCPTWTIPPLPWSPLFHYGCDDASLMALNKRLHAHALLLIGIELSKGILTWNVDTALESMCKLGPHSYIELPRLY